MLVDRDERAGRDPLQLIDEPVGPPGIHRALDVKKVQAEVRHAELENVRLASRALKGKDEDPDIEKKIVVQTDGSPISVIDGN